MRLPLALAALLLASPALAATFGKVDLQRALLTIDQGAAVAEQLKAAYAEKQAELQKEDTAIREAQADLARRAASLARPERARREKELQERVAALQQRSQDYQAQMQQMEQELKTPVLERLQGVVNEVSARSGVDLVLEANAPVLYIRDEKDLTGDVIRAYNAQYPK